jgi:diguanylate cyclase
VAYYAHIVNYANRIRRTGDATEIIRILDEALQETRGLHAIDELDAARRQVAEAEGRIESLKAELEEVSGLLREDPLTGTLNRRGLEEVYARESARADRHGSPLCLVLLDLDNFKQLNDTHGHQAGDEALVELARTARQDLRPNDALARFGGEEFVLLLPDTDRDSAVAATTRLRTLLAELPLLHAGKQIRISFSAGIALRNPGESMLNLVGRADEALYRAKQAGKDRFEDAKP